MLQELAVKNFGLIEDMKISFQNGFHVITGETGAGKSMIIDALNVIVGGRASSDLIRYGCETAYVEALFIISDEIINKINDYGIDADSNDLIVAREIKIQGKSTCRINGKLVTVHFLKEIMEPFIDLHGQHEHQKLLHTKEHLRLLDGYGKTELNEQLLIVKNLFFDYKRLLTEFNEIHKNEQDASQRIEFLKFQVQDLTQLNLSEGEEEELENKKKILSNQEKLFKNAHLVKAYLKDGTNEGLGASELIHQAMLCLQEIAKIDSKYNEQIAILENVTVSLEDVALEAGKTLDSEATEEDINSIEARLFELQQVKRKYRKDIPQLIIYMQQLEDELHKLENKDSLAKDLQDKLLNLKQEFVKQAKLLTKLRKHVAEQMEVAMKDELKQLSLPKVNFEISFIELDEPQHTGIDAIEFLFSANPGEPLRPLAKIASGGELSRIMLAFKNLLANIDCTPTVIFDEVDTGVSGLAAQKIAEKLAAISRNRQVFCVTHMPQIAAMSDVHMFIKKDFQSNKTITKLEILDDEEITKELGRMISGENITTSTLKHAQEMRKIANNFKKIIANDNLK
ncbi:DNA repair protein RecN [Desulfuribacillus alkaliarsenatis]|uniref:DNA repair protein RecN n=1 Tax=Desulfuribacillus alkaliarsenatis TaxID=766136 RepID=A0A1E5G5S7_9FIRM|nr:DNA repair protein RecN [Desulfuribacillus alkaliarsenatis]OEF98455.1 DNA repair protein RecN [Desulfuribacillus alkaliarsenatis]